MAALLRCVRQCGGLRLRRRRACAIPGDKVIIGALSDFSGPFAGQLGKGALVGAQLAAQDFASEAGGPGGEIISSDHQEAAARS